MRVGLVYDRFGDTPRASSYVTAAPTTLPMRLQAIVHDDPAGGFWAEVPAIPGCATQGETVEELMQNLAEAVEGCLSVELPELDEHARVVEIAV